MGKEFQRNKRENLKAKCLAYLGGKQCKSCGNKGLPQFCYAFHHLNPALKVFEISKAAGMSWKEIKEELDKCVVVCRNCHAILDKHSAWPQAKRFSSEDRD